MNLHKIKEVRRRTSIKEAPSRILLRKKMGNNLFELLSRHIIKSELFTYLMEEGNIEILLNGSRNILQESLMV